MNQHESQHIYPIDASAPDAPLIDRAARLLRDGQLVAFPTETVYGLGANALDPAAVERIFVAKGRPATNPVIAHVHNIEGAHKLVASWPDTAQKLADAFWPGPLTIVLPRADIVPDIVTAGGATIAIRIPQHPIALALIAAADLPIAAPSANKSTHLSPVRAQHVAQNFTSEQVPMILDGGPTTRGIESVVIDLSDPNSPPRILRPGVISPAEIERVTGAPVIVVQQEKTVEPARSPGQMSRHYAPRTALYLCPTNELDAFISHLKCSGKRVHHLQLPETPSAAAATLYDSLHSIDLAQTIDVIVIAEPPAHPDWDGVCDRLRRAATLKPQEI